MVSVQSTVGLRSSRMPESVAARTHMHALRRGKGPRYGAPTHRVTTRKQVPDGPKLGDGQGVEGRGTTRCREPVPVGEAIPVPGITGQPGANGASPVEDGEAGGGALGSSSVRVPAFSMEIVLPRWMPEAWMQ